jgi:hypothetical protein
MKIKTHELIGNPLNWAVAKCEGLRAYKDAMLDERVKEGWWISDLSEDPNNWIPISEYSPSTKWSQGGPIIEREKIDLLTEKRMPDSWLASVARYQNGKRLIGWRLHQYGPTPLVAAMRCYVALKLGDEVEVPDGLI